MKEDFRQRKDTVTLKWSRCAPSIFILCLSSRLDFLFRASESFGIWKIHSQKRLAPDLPKSVTSKLGGCKYRLVQIERKWLSE